MAPTTTTDKAARGQALQGPAGNTRSRGQKPTAGLSYFQTRVRTGKVSKPRSTKPKATPPTTKTTRKSKINSKSGPSQQGQKKDANGTFSRIEYPAPGHPLQLGNLPLGHPPLQVIDGVEYMLTSAPTSKTIAAASGNQSTPTGGPPQQKGAGSSSGGGKRPVDGGGNADGDQAGGKRPKIEGEDGQDQQESQQEINARNSAADPCAFASRSIETMLDLADDLLIDGTEQFVEPGQQLVNTTVFRAVAAVAEAISTSGRGVQFSLIEDTALSVARTGVVQQPTTRPGNDVLIPWIPSNGHISLYIVRRNGASNNFTIQHFDSASSAHHRALQARSAAGNLIRRVLNQTGWDRSGSLTITPGVPVTMNRTRQFNSWECGMHTIFSAWAHALGLQLADQPQQGNRANEDFLRLGRHLINAAMLGIVDSETIRAFLDCYGFVMPGQTVPVARSFLSTVEMQTQDSYRRNNARVRIETDLDLRRANGENLPPLDTILADLGRRGVQIGSLVDYDAQQLLDDLALLSGFDNPGASAATQNNTAPTIPNPNPSPDDEDMAITQALLAEAADRQAAKEAAEQAARDAAEQAARTNTTAGNELTGGADPPNNTDNTGSAPRGGSGNNNSTGPTHPPPTGSNHDNDNGDGGAPPGADGTTVDSSNQTNTQQDGNPPTSDVTGPGDQPASGDSTPGTISGAGSDDGFFGNSNDGPLPPATEELPVVEENADLAAFREQDEMRVARAQAAEQRLQAARDTAGGQESGPQEQGDGAGDVDVDMAAHLPAAEESVEQAEPQQHQQQGNTTNDLFGDNDSLFGEDQGPSQPAAPPAHPSGLSLPPTPIRNTFSANTEPVADQDVMEGVETTEPET